MLRYIQLTIALMLTAYVAQVSAQGLHFSQYYNAPILLNPAYTGYLQDNQYRVGTNYRNQWATVPVNYNTFSIFSDFALFKNRWETSWLGTGVAMWRDVAGAGKLSLTKVQANLAYHLLLGERGSFSMGMASSFNQRSVDFSKLTFDVQWDEFSFNRNAPNMETFSVQKTNFVDIAAGANYAYFNNNNLYLNVGVSALHINQPVETFYGMSNKLGLRPQVNIDAVFKASDRVMVNPSVYYTRQKRASQLVGGSMFNFNVSGETMLNPNEFLIGVFYRNKDAIIGAAGYKWKQHKFMVSYDHTISEMSQGNGGLGAFEFSLILQGAQKDNSATNAYGCPRF